MCGFFLCPERIRTSLKDHTEAKDPERTGCLAEAYKPPPMYRNGTKKLAVLMAVGTVMGGVFPATLNAITTATAYDTGKNPSHIQALNPLDQWIEELVMLESRGKTNLKILDTNKKHSFGCLQFQKATFVEYGLKYKFFDSADDAVEKIYDCEFQKRLAKRMIEDDARNWRHWYTSVAVKKLGPPPAPRHREVSAVSSPRQLARITR